MQRYFARDQTLTYPLCTMTVTVYHTTFNPFECRRAVLEGVHYETRHTARGTCLLSRKRPPRA